MQSHKVLSIQNGLKATKGHFRAVAMIASEPYHINQDTPSLEVAKLYCQLEPEGTQVQVYNDQGEPQINHEK